MRNHVKATCSRDAVCNKCTCMECAHRYFTPNWDGHTCQGRPVPGTMPGQQALIARSRFLYWTALYVEDRHLLVGRRAWSQRAAVLAVLDYLEREYADPMASQADWEAQTDHVASLRKAWLPRLPS